MCTIVMKLKKYRFNSTAASVVMNVNIFNL